MGGISSPVELFKPPVNYVRDVSPYTYASSAGFASGAKSYSATPAANTKTTLINVTGSGILQFVAASVTWSAGNSFSLWLTIDDVAVITFPATAMSAGGGVVLLGGAADAGAGAVVLDTFRFVKNFKVESQLNGPGTHYAHVRFQLW